MRDLAVFLAVFGLRLYVRGHYGLLVKDLINKVLFFKTFYAFDLQFLGDLTQFSQELLIKLKNVIHVH